MNCSNSNKASRFLVSIILFGLIASASRPAQAEEAEQTITQDRTSTVDSANVDPPEEAVVSPEARTDAPRTSPEPRTSSPRTHVVRGGNLDIPAGDRVEDVVVMGGSATIGAGAAVEGDVVVFGGSMRVGPDVEIAGNVVAFGGSVSLDAGSDVGGDVVAVGGSVRVGPGGTIAGDAVTMGGSVSLEEGATVLGSQVRVGAGRAMREAFGRRGIGEHRPHRPHRIAPWPSRYLHRVSVFFVAFAIGVIALSIMPRRMPVLSGAVKERLGVCVLAGLLTFLAFVPLVVLLAVTVIGILLIPLLLIAYGVLIFVGWAAAALALGRILPGAKDRSEILNLAVGMALFAALGVVALIPFAGLAAGIALAAGTLAGVGAIVITRFGQVSQQRPPASDEQVDLSQHEVREGTPV